jgi:hypothetical protein
MKSGRISRLLPLLACLGALAFAPGAFAAASGSFTPTGQMGTARTHAAVAPLADGRVLVAGGYGGAAGWLQSAEIYNPASGTFSPVPNNMTTPREGAAAVLLGDGRVLIAGGFNSSSFHLQSAEVFNPASNTFSPVSNLSVIRSSPAGAPLPGGGALIAGGFATSGPMNVYRSSAEIFNSGGTAFTSSGVGSMGTGRVSAMAAPLPDGRVLIAGGNSASLTTENTAELFDPSSKTFSSGGIGQMTSRRSDGAASPLPDGRVLILAGLDVNTDLKTGEAFDPATKSFSSVGIPDFPSGPTFGLAAAPLQDGRVLVVGGGPTIGSPTKNAELFTLAPPSKTLAFTVQGKRLLADAPVAGTVTVTGAGGKKASAAKKGRSLLKTSSASGGPGTITVRLRPLGAAKRKLRQKGKVRVRATLQFTPKSTGCVPTFKQCYSYATTQKAKLKIKRKKK